MARLKEITGEVLIAESPVVEIGRAQIEDLKRRARANPRQRMRICAHKSPQDRLHEMLIVLTDQVYIRPHKHTNKSESFHVIEGTARIIFFDETGKVVEVLTVGDAASGQPFYFRNDDPRYHTQIILSDALVFHEVTNGPFNREETIFAPWAPEEGEPGAVAAYLGQLRKEVEQFLAGAAL